MTAAYDELPIGVAVARRDRTIVSVNARLAQMLGLAAADVVGRDWASFVHAADRDQTTTEWQRAVAAVEGTTVDCRMVTPDGRLTHLRVDIAPRQADGHEWVATVVDVTVQREALVQLFHHAPAAIAILRGPSFVYELSNEMNQRLLGGRDVIGKSVREAFPEAEVQGLLGLLEHVYRSGEPYVTKEIAVKVVEGSGTLRDTYVAGTYTPLRDARGSVEGVLAFAYEVTEQVEARERQKFLAEAGRALATSLEYAATIERAVHLAAPRIAEWCFVDVVGEDGVIERVAVAHPEGVDASLVERVRSFVPDASATSTYPPSVALATSKSVLIPEVDATSFARDPGHLDILRAVALRSVISVPLIAHGRTHGAMTFGRSHARACFDEDDLTLVEALAGQVALHVDNARLYSAATAASRAKDEFLATVSHELRTPLSSILGWASLVRAAPSDPAAVAKGLEVIERNARSQLRLVEDILDLSRVVRGEMRLTLQTFSLSTLAREVVETVAPSARAKEITLTLTGDTDSFRLVADPDRLRQVMWNLLANAVKFTPNGGSVDLTLERGAGSVGIVVKDTGRGMDASFVPQVFVPFRQADGRSTGAAGGVGLGLAIVRHIVEAHGGSVAAESEGVGRGSTFRVTLPISTVARRPDETARQARFVDRTKRLAGVAVLVVEDDPDGRELVELTLAREGAQVRSAADASAALLALEGAVFDVVLSDIGLPEHDGYWLAREIKKRRPDQPLVALTAFGRPEDVRQALDAGFRAHLTKPVDPTELVETLTRSMARP